MLDFPSPATNGQLFASGGMTWRYDGTKWSETAGTLALADAPSDGNTYGRRNTAWNSVDAMLAPVAANANAALNDSGRSLVHNGQFNIAQRGTGPFTTSVYTLDRWANTLSLDTMSVTQSALNDTNRTQIGDGAAAFALVNAFTGNAGAGAFNFILHRIEDLRRLSGKTVTVSFWAAAASGTPKLGIGLAQAFGTGGSPSAGVNLSGQSVTISTTFTRYSVTFSVPSVSGKTLGTNGDHYTELEFWFSCGATNAAIAGAPGVQSGTISLWGVQLEIGSIATPLAKRDPQQELALCQRFYQTGNTQMYQDTSAAGRGVSTTLGLPVTMRALPTVGNVTAPGPGNGTGFTVTPLGSTSVMSYCTSVAAGQVNVAINFTLSADL